ncbi:hypothetical protein N7448_003309 [Penicillium atrosanguineum]|uniref:GPI anchored serine-threonine rich protein n=1 Tax=Penicillium atrosanguineum TaxID=1132637 RepID=A0A9W9PYY3_9EURO|nr:uncharacterized protein N7443_002279 [Penicillium atrosanguineum]KAJ5122178.1 hypothetical protein N7526_009115 [Penicillium atrosanguineum]KAJ5139901.1 hypothetical protein N7448_003309 [Penicillium atrosanguineum]KAJ5309818.1 hypothetical protein N7443_002279 [Penicillium atrosanguineum]KAJ5315337.1 hypothetical protein N7476_005644 [Penicillium atrosanguineum]
MRFITANLSLLLAASASLVAAQDLAPTPSASAVANGLCADQRVVDTCVEAMKRGLAICSDDNWDCKCSGQANIANCYVDCPNVPDAFSAQLASEKDCATANHYDKGITDVPQTWTTPGPQTATVTPADVSVPGETESAAQVHPTETAAATATEKMNKAEETAKSGAAAGKASGSWLALVGLGLGVMF